MIQHSSPISGIDAYDNYVATAGYDNLVCIWDAVTHEVIASASHNHLANQCQFSRCGKYLLTTSSDYTAKLWSVPSLKPIATYGHHLDDVESASIHPFLPYIITASRDSYVRLFDYHGTLVKEIKAHKKDVLTVKWLTENEFLTSSDDGTVKKWNINTETADTIFNSDSVEVDTVTANSDGIIFIGSDSGDVIVVSGADKKIFRAHQAGVKRLVYSESAKLLVSASYDQKLIFWLWRGEAEIEKLKEVPIPEVVWCRSFAFGNNDKIVFSSFGSSYATYDCKKNEWDTSKIKCTQGINSICEFDKKIYAVGDAGIITKEGSAFADVGSLCNFIRLCANQFITGGHAGKVFNISTGHVIYHHYSPLNCMTTFYYKNRESMLIGTYTGEGILLVWDNENFIHDKTIKLHNGAVKSLASSKDYIFSVCADGSAALHDINTLSLQKLYQGVHGKIANGCVHVGRNIFVSVSRDLRLRFFEGEQVNVISTPFDHSLKCVSADTTSRYVAVGTYCGKVGVYDTETSQWKLFMLSSGGISNIVYSDDKKAFIASGYNGSIYTVNEKEYSN